MTETLTHPQPEVVNPTLDLQQWGDTAVDALDSHELDSSVALNWQPDSTREGFYVSEEASLYTNLPAEAFKLDEKQRVYIPATALDLLNAGEYSLQDPSATASFTVFETEAGTKYVTGRATRSNHYNAGDKRAFDSRLMPPEFGSFYLSEAFASQLTTEAPRGTGVIKILEGFGYDFTFLDDPTAEKTMRIPTPQTLQKIIEQHGLPIVMLADDNGDGPIPAEAYLKAFAEGNYPVGVADLGIYVHDVRSNDHLPGAIIAGNEVFGVWGTLAQAALEQKKYGILGYFDDATNLLTSIALRFAENRLRINNQADAYDAALSNLTGVALGYEKYRRELNVTGVDANAFLDLLKNRLATMHEQYNFGSEFSGFLEYISDKQVDTSILDVAPEQSLPEDDIG